MLSLEAHDQIARFATFTAGHPRLLAADRAICSFVEAPAGAPILMVFGPTGAGKTTLLERVLARITNDRANSLLVDPQRFGPISMKCPAPAGGAFSWSEFLVRALTALQEPGPADKVVVPDDPRLPIEATRWRNVGDLRRAFESAVIARKPPAIFVDEAGHLARVGTGERLMAQLDFIKSLADATDAVFVLVGTYDLLALRNLSGQLGRRCQEVHLARYLVDDPGDERSFRSVINTFAQQLPMDASILLERSDWVYTRSAGCVGILKEWLDRALAAALEDEVEISFAHIERTALAGQALRAVADEIRLGEAALEETPETMADIEEMLGVSAKGARESARDEHAQGSIASAPGPAPAMRPSDRRPRPKVGVGKRSPGRDPVGSTA